MELAALLGVRPGVTAVIGGGGKTTLLRTLGGELAAAGARVLLCTTTKILPFPDLPCAVTAAELERLERRLSSLLGFEMDGYVLVNLDAFVKVVDLVGGVTVNVPQAMLAFGTGGASTAGQLGAQAGTLETALRSLVSNPRFWLAYGQNAGESYAKA